MYRKKQLRRKAPLNRRPPTRSKRTPSKVRKSRKPSMEFWRRQRAVVLARAGGRCERCGDPLTLDTLEAHHRRLRSQGGGHGLENLTALCQQCHHVEVHGRPERAVDEGFIVPSYRNPAARPVRLFDGREVLLTPDGGYVVVPFKNEEQAS